MNVSSWTPLIMSETELIVTMTTKPVSPIFSTSVGSTIFLLGQVRKLEVILLLNSATTNMYTSYFSFMFPFTLLKISGIHSLQPYNCHSPSPYHLVYGTCNNWILTGLPALDLGQFPFRSHPPHSHHNYLLKIKFWQLYFLRTYLKLYRALFLASTLLILIFSHLPLVTLQCCLKFNKVNEYVNE